MELALKCWFLEQQDKVNLSGDMLRAKAACFPQELHPNAPEMALSQGWLEKFKDRHEIKSFRRFGESDALDMEAIGAVLPDICVVGDAYIEKDVFNMDETGLYWRLQADNSLATHQLEGRKINKEHITLVICANSNNNEKIPLTIIDKHLNPHCFKGIKCDTLGARYHANAKAWMTQDVFQLWLLDFDRRMQGCQILLLLDNYPGHIPLEKFAEMNVVLRNTHVFYQSQPGWRMFCLPQLPTASAIAKSGPVTSSTHNKGKLVLPPPLSRSCSIKWFNFHTGIPWTSAIFSTIRRKTTTLWRQMMRTSPTTSLKSSAHSRMKTRQVTTTTVWNR